VTEPERDGGEPRSFDDWLRQFTSEPGLVPVALVVIGCFTAIGAGVLLAALRARNLAALAALVLLALGSADLLQRDLRRRRRLGLASRLVLGLWLLSAAAAVAAVTLGLA
jgi:hypothetical protein